MLIRETGCRVYKIALYCFSNFYVYLNLFYSTKSVFKKFTNGKPSLNYRFISKINVIVLHQTCMHIYLCRYNVRADKCFKRNGKRVFFQSIRSEYRS